jgi:hypothetical protein
MKKQLLICFISVFCLTTLNAQTVSTFIETDSNGCSGLTIDEDFLYVVSSFSGNVFRKSLTSANSDYETFNIGASGYQGICKIGDFVYVSKPSNGAYGIYRFNPDAETINLESFISLNSVFGLAKRNSELYFSSQDKIYKVDLNTSSPSSVEIAANIAGTSGFSGSTMGLKIYDDFLYFSDANGISRINLNSGNYELETITTYTGESFAKAGENTFYLTNDSAVYELNIQTQTYSLLVEIENFIGTYDIVFANNSLFVTTLEGDFNKVARIDLETLNTNSLVKEKDLLFPNPATGYITLSGFDPFENVTIVATNGQVIKSVKTENGTIDVSDLAAGVYFVKSKNVYRRFIKQ